jgi:hypothetical protein
MLSRVRVPVSERRIQIEERIVGMFGSEQLEFHSGCSSLLANGRSQKLAVLPDLNCKVN